MGENRGTTETKRMTSIVRKLHLSWIGRKLSMYVGWDFFLFVVLTVGWLCDQEITRLGGIKAGYQRSIENFPSIKKMTYVVRNGNGKVLMDIEVYHTLLVIGILLAAVLVMVIIGSYLSQYMPDTEMGLFSVAMTLFMGAKFVLKPDSGENRRSGLREGQRGKVLSILAGAYIGLYCGFVGLGSGLLHCQ